MNSSSFYQILDLPKIPNWIIEKHVDNMCNIKLIKYREHHTKQKIKTLNNQLIDYASFASWNLTDTIQIWFQDQILPQKTNNIATNLQFFFNEQSNNKVFAYPAHLDRRGRVLLYNIDNGGLAKTAWHKEKDKPIYRHRNHIDYDPKCNLQELDLLHDVYFKQNQWILLETRILHSITNMIGFRIAFTLNIPNEDVNAFCEYHKIDPQSSNIWNADPVEPE